MSTPVAAQLAELVERLLGAPLPVRIRAWDGSEAGATTGPVVVIRHRRALRRLLWSPGELGLARAFVAGELEVEGDVADGLSRFWTLAKDHPRPRFGTPEVLAATRLALRLGAVGPRP
ncbi:MAG TPA: SAM-dependent methyltransferase, partial [Pseudonocardia sp.]|nr:SAM-dependent methyltransferase [Pseudonocardia sp.]